MLYTEKEKHEIERVRVKEVFAEHLRQSPDFELLWSDKVGYVWLTIGVNPLYVDALIDKGENRDREIRKPRPSIRAQLKADKAKTAPKKAAAKTKNHDMEV